MILGDPQERMIINFVSLVIRKYIYWVKLKEQKPSFREFNLLLCNIYNIELFNARANDKVNFHQMKWLPLHQFCVNTNTSLVEV